MRKKRQSKAIIRSIIKWIISFAGIVAMASVFSFAQAPTFEGSFAGELIQGDAPFRTIPGLSPDQSLQDNIVQLFYPDVTGQTSILRRYIRIIGVAILIVMIMVNAAQLLLNGSESEKVSKALKNIVYILIGGLVFYASAWILGSALNIANVGQADQFVTAIQNKFLFQIITMLKALAFFLAIIAMAVAGFKVMAAMDQEDKVKAGRSGVINVIVALVFIKVIDFVYVLAQTPSFTGEVTGIVISVVKLMGRIIGAALVLAIIYSGYLLITDNGSGDGAKKAKNLIINVFLVGLVIFLFLLIIYQLVGQFG